MGSSSNANDPMSQELKEVAQKFKKLPLTTFNICSQQKSMVYQHITIQSLHAFLQRKSLQPVLAVRGKWEEREQKRRKKEGRKEGAGRKGMMMEKERRCKEEGSK